MDESPFQLIGHGDVATVLLVVALAAAVTGLAVGVIRDGRRRQVWRWAVLGALAGATGLAVLGGWHLVVARTRFHDRLYAGSGPQGAGRGSAPSTQADAAKAPGRRSEDGLVWDGRPTQGSDTSSGRGWLPAGRLDSVGNLVLLGALFALGGLVAGLVWGRVLRGLRGAEQEWT